jgi:hypothetical protein
MPHVAPQIFSIPIASWHWDQLFSTLITVLTIESSRNITIRTIKTHFQTPKKRLRLNQRRGGDKATDNDSQHNNPETNIHNHQLIPNPVQNHDLPFNELFLRAKTISTLLY